MAAVVEILEEYCMFQRLSVRWGFALLATASFGLLGSGLILGEVARLQPCHLCSLQRFLYLTFGSVSLLGVLVPGGRRFWSVLLILIAAGGVAAAGQQSWMQYAPQLATECGFGEPTLTEQLVNWLGVKWPAMFMVTGFCTQKDWVFLGLTLANWSVPCFFALMLASFWMLRRRLRPTWR